MKGMFLLPRLPWPTHDGQAVIAHHLLRTLLDRGHTLSCALLEPADDAALSQWPLRQRVNLHIIAPDEGQPLSRAQARWMNYFGLPHGLPAGVQTLIEHETPDYVEAFGLQVLPLLGDIRRMTRVIWMAADDRCLHQLTMLRTRRGVGEVVRTLRQAAVMAAYERQFTACVDAVVAVSESDRRALRWIGGYRNVVTITNGVELPVMPPVEPLVQPRTVMFWGNLDFEPNIEAIRWFAEHVWPGLAAEHGDAMWWIAGSGRGESVAMATATLPGVKLLGCVDDLTSVARRVAAVVIPMRDGTGVKNKLLEAAAMARPIIASPRAVHGLSVQGEAPWIVARSPAEWIEEIRAVWSDLPAAAALGLSARNYVAQHHDWSAAAARHDQLIRSLGPAPISSPTPHPRRAAA